MSPKEQLLQRIENRSAVVGVVGLGYVGLPLVQGFHDAGFRVVGVDVDARKVQALKEGRSYITDLSDEEVQHLQRSGRFHPTTDYRALEQADAILITVPTPLSKTRDPDISYVMAAVREIQKILRPGQVVVLESTTYPGTTDELVKPELEQSGLTCGRDFFLAFSPERINPGDSVYALRNTPKVVGGVDPDSTEVATRLYEQVIERVVPVSSAKVAEMSKLLENTFRSVNIALVNEMAIAANILQIDIWEVIEAAGTKPFGFMKFYPGPGIGGHCIPIDPHYLAWKLKTLNYNARFIELASEINTFMPRYVVTRIQDVLNEQAKPLKGSRILVLGVAYKPDVNDLRESPALDVMQLLLEKGVDLQYHDPYIPEVRIGRQVFRSVPLTPEVLRGADLTVILTHHSNVDYEAVVRHAPLVFDTRNATRGVQGAEQKVMKL